MSIAQDLKHAAYLAKQFGKIRSFALEALLHAALSTIEAKMKASTGHTLGQNLEAMRHLLHIIRNGSEAEGLERTIFEKIFKRDDVDPVVVGEAESLLEELDEVQSKIESEDFPSANRLEMLFDTYTQMRIRTSSFLRQVEALVEQWRIEVEQDADVRQRMSGAISDLERMSGAINILAINASVEAARAGQEGAAFRVIANEMQRLSSQSAVMLKGTRDSLGLNNLEKPSKKDDAAKRHDDLELKAS
jgi:hypothetical protein